MKLLAFIFINKTMLQIFLWEFSQTFEIVFLFRIPLDSCISHSYYLISNSSFWFNQNLIWIRSFLSNFFTFPSKNRRPWCNRKQTKSLLFHEEVVHFVSESGTPLSTLPENLSIFLQNTSQYFCGSPLSIFAKHFSESLKTTYKYFCRIICSSFDENFPRKPLSMFSEYLFSVFVEDISVVLLNTSQYFFEIMFQYFCITFPSIFKNSLQQFCRAPLGMFVEYLYVILQKIFSKKTIFVIPDKYIVFYQNRIFEL